MILYLHEILRVGVILFLYQSLAEYMIHRLVHHYKIKYHSPHHCIWSTNDYNKYNADAHVRCFIMILFGMQYYIPALMLLKYETFHTISHTYPNNYLFHHHRLHHYYPKYNFAVTAIWTDKLFGTFREQR